MGKLVLFLQDGTTLPIRLNKERMVIGRRADNDICLPHPAVSGEHAQVVTILADSFLEDLGSTNGTLVNGKAVAKHFLRDRDQIDIGRQRMVYLADDAAEFEALPLPAAARAELKAAYERVPRARKTSAARPDAPPPASALREETLPGDPPPAPNARIDTAEVEPPPESQAPTPQPQAPTPVPEPRGALLRVLSGPSAGRMQSVDRDEVSLGRVGVQVARILREGNRYRLVPVEGDTAPRVNGNPVGADGVELNPGDTLEVAGTEVEFGPALP